VAHTLHRTTLKTLGAFEPCNGGQLIANLKCYLGIVLEPPQRQHAIFHLPMSQSHSWFICGHAHGVLYQFDHEFSHASQRLVNWTPNTFHHWSQLIRNSHQNRSQFNQFSKKNDTECIYIHFYRVFKHYLSHLWHNGFPYAQAENHPGFSILSYIFYSSYPNSTPLVNPQQILI